MLHTNNSSLNAEILAAIAIGDIEQLRVLTQSEDVMVKDIVELTMIPRANGGHTPFISAAARGHYGVVHYLLWLTKRYSGVVDLDALDANNLNALMHAAVGGHESVVTILLKNGCDARIEFQDTQQKTPPVTIAMLANNAGHQAIAEILEKAAAAKKEAANALRDKEAFVFYKPAEIVKPAVESDGKKRRVTFAKMKRK